MKRTLAFLLVLTLVLGVLTGCGGSTSESTKAPETTAAAIATVGATEATEADPSADKYGETLVYCPGVQDEQNLGNPSAATNMLMDLNAAPALESLFRQNAQGEIVCWLAKDYSVSEDGLVYVIQIREGISFHDGSPPERRERSLEYPDVQGQRQGPVFPGGNSGGHR